MKNYNVVKEILNFENHLNDVLINFLYVVKVDFLEFRNVVDVYLFDYNCKCNMFHFLFTVVCYDVNHLRLNVHKDVVLHLKVFSFNENYIYVYHNIYIVVFWFHHLFLFFNDNEVVV